MAGQMAVVATAACRTAVQSERWAISLDMAQALAMIALLGCENKGDMLTT
jgi:hypothetical protein